MAQLKAAEVYSENGHNYRFFLTWRHAAFGGYLVVLWAVLSLVVETLDRSTSMARLICVSAAPLGLVFWAIDWRVQQLFRAAVRVARDLEAAASLPGFFGSQADFGTLPRADQKYPLLRSHTSMLSTVYLSSSLFWIGLAVFLPRLASTSVTAG